MDKVYFNINQYVYVKLTEYGKEVYLNFINKPYIILNGEEKYKRFEDLWLKPEKDGYYRFQFWRLIETFGEHTSVGFSNCFETDIYFDKKDLKEQS